MDTLDGLINAPAKSRPIWATSICPLSDHSEQMWILARDGLSANDPEETIRMIYSISPEFNTTGGRRKSH